jgi:hypothetical protein
MRAAAGQKSRGLHGQAAGIVAKVAAASANEPVEKKDLICHP